MDPRPATGARPTAGGDAAPTIESARLARADRREALLDVAAEMVASGDVEDVSMESVADMAGVSRALLYKHFANRRELLSALYERESAQLHDELTGDVQAATDVAGMLRALVRGALAAQASRGATFAALGQSGGRSGAQRNLQRRRDRSTLRYFSEHAVEEFQLDRRVAAAALGIALGAIPAVLAQWRQDPTPERATLLEDSYVAMTIGGLKELRGQA